MSIYERTEMLLGKSSVERLNNCRVAVFGLGGVGGHAAEALARSGIGSLTLIDADTVAESNINRQIFATQATVGMAKTDAAAERILNINPAISLVLRQAFVLPENIGEFGIGSFDYVIDAVDTVSAKLAIVKTATAAGVPVISAMGAGNKLDPTKFEVTDIYKTTTCPLAAVMRRELRRAGVPHLKVVYSREAAVSPEFYPENENSRRNPPASCAFVPSVAGLIIAGEVIRELCAAELSASLDARRKKEADK